MPSRRHGGHAAAGAQRGARGRPHARLAPPGAASGDYLKANGIRHSPVFTGGIGWVLAAEDPDARHLRFYTLETHPVTTEFSSDPYWLSR